MWGNLKSMRHDLQYLWTSLLIIKVTLRYRTYTHKKLYTSHSRLVRQKITLPRFLQFLENIPTLSRNKFWIRNWLLQNIQVPNLKFHLHIQYILKCITCNSVHMIILISTLMLQEYTYLLFLFASNWIVLNAFHLYLYRTQTRKTGKTTG